MSTCLLGEQTRRHRDLDVVVPRPDLDRAASLLRSRGFEVVRDWLPTSIALRDPEGREVDLHPVDPTPDGGGDQVLLDGTTWHYGPPVDGSVSGRSLCCASAEEQVLMRLGYEPRPEDLTDLRRLCDRFGLAWPFSRS